MIYPKLVALALCVLPALAAPSPLLRISKTRSPVPGKYIVTLRQGQQNSDNITLEAFSDTLSSASTITHWWEHMNAFAGDFSDDDLEVLRVDSRVDAIEEDGIVTALVSVTQCASFPPTLFVSADILMPADLDQNKRPLGFESNIFQEKACYPERPIAQLHLRVRQYLRSRLYRVYHRWVSVSAKRT